MGWPEVNIRTLLIEKNTFIFVFNGPIRLTLPVPKLKFKIFLIIKFK